MTVSGKQPSYLPKLDEVKERVRDELISERARDVLKQKAAEVAAKLRGAADFEKAAKAAGFEAKTTEFLNRDGAVPDVGAAPELLDAAFKLPQGGVSDPLSTESGVAIVKVIEKENVSPDDYKARKDAFRDEYLNDQKNRFFGNYMMKAKQGMKIEVSPEAVQRAVE